MNTTPSTADTTRDARMRWWHEARFGMFVHWGLYSQLGQYEWAMNLDRIPVSEYEPLADSWQPKPGAAREWAALAKAAGMKYMVLTTKHHEGFCLWDTRQTDFNAQLRQDLNAPQVPFVAGELPQLDEKFLEVNKLFNEQLQGFGSTVSNYACVSAKDLTDGGDKLHLDTNSARIFGQRYAEAMLRLLKAPQAAPGTQDAAKN